MAWWRGTYPPKAERTRQAVPGAAARPSRPCICEAPSRSLADGAGLGERWLDLDARDTGLGVWVADIPGSDGLASGDAVRFTIWWAAGAWEGRDFRVVVGG